MSAVQPSREENIMDFVEEKEEDSDKGSKHSSS